MKTLLRNTKDGTFFLGPGNWTEHPDLAYDFHFVDRALNYARTWELEGVELAFVSEDPEEISTAPLERQAARLAA